MLGATSFLRRRLIRLKVSPRELIIEEIGGLALKRGAEPRQRRKANAFHFAGAEERQLRFAEADDLGELVGADAAGAQDRVKCDPYRHQTKSRNSASSAAARRQSVGRKVDSPGFRKAGATNEKLDHWAMLINRPMV